MNTHDTADTQAPYAYTPPADATPLISRWARLALTAFLAFWGAQKLSDPLNYYAFMIDDLLTAFHEFGHYIFQPFGIEIFGRTMVRLAGSLFEVVFPLLFVGYFLLGPRAHRDTHAAMVCLWVVAIGFAEVGVYVADARARELMLLSGVTGKEDVLGHDWFNILLAWNMLEKDLAIAATLQRMAWLLFWVSTGVGAYAAWQRGKPEATQGADEAGL